ncbi:MAG: hypothetical protein ACE3L7_21020 [Candidatus Pristimantibacillus sp.]
MKNQKPSTKKRPYRRISQTSSILGLLVDSIDPIVETSPIWSLYKPSGDK